MVRRCTPWGASRQKNSGSTFFSGVPWLNRLPLGLVNWSLLATLGALRWESGEAFVGAFVADPK